MTVCLIGWSGLIGSHVLQLLQNDPKVDKIICIGRKSLETNNSKVESIKAELSELSKLNPIPAQHWICCLGTTIKVAKSRENFKKVDFEGVVEFAKLAERSDALSLHVVSALGADVKSPIFYNQVKGEMETAIKSLNIPHIQVVQPSLLLGERKEWRAGEALAISLAPLYSPLMLGPLKKFRPIEANKVALAICEDLHSPEKPKDRFTVHQFN